jgi:hypothetical protein
MADFEFDWLEKLEHNFGTSYMSLELSLNDLIKNEHVKSLAESSKEKLKQISCLFHQLMEHNQRLSRTSKEKDFELQKLILLIDSAHEHTQRLKSPKPPPLEISKTLIEELINDQDYNGNFSMSDDKTADEITLNLMIATEEEEEEEEENNLEYEFKGTTQTIPCEPVVSHLSAPQTDPRLSSKRKTQIVLLNCCKYETTPPQLSQTKPEPVSVPTPAQSILSLIMPLASVKAETQSNHSSQNLASSLALNLNLPASISSILFKKSTEASEKKPSSSTTPPKYPRQITTNPLESNNPVFNKIQSILTNGIKAPQGGKVQPKNKYITAQTDTYVIRRSKPLENSESSTEALKSQMVVLLENEKVQPVSLNYQSNQQAMVLKRAKNPHLAKMFSQRNSLKIEDLKRRYAHIESELFEDFMCEAELVKNLALLMNYDFCANKFNPNKLAMTLIVSDFKYSNGQNDRRRE